MSVLSNLVVQMSCNTSALDAGLKSAKGHVDKFGSSMGTALKVGAAAGAVGLGIAATAAFDFAKAAMEDEQSVLRLKQAVENTGVSWTDYGGKLDSAVTAAQKMAFSDDASRAALSLLMAQTGDAEDAMRRFTLAQDVARGAGIDLETSSRLLGKASEENADVFKKMGISLGEGATEAEAFAALQQKFGGQAAVYAQSTAGQFAVAGIAMGELKESIGYALLPVMNTLATFVTSKLIPAMQKLADEWIPKIKEGFTKVGEALRPAIDKITPFFKMLSENKDAMTVAAAIIGGVLVGAFIALGVAAGSAAIGVIAATWPFLAIGAAIAVAIAAGVLIIKHWDDISAAVTSFLDKVKEIPILGDIVTALEGVVKSTIGNIVDYFKSIIQVGKDIIEFFKCVFTGDFSGAWDAIKKLTGDILTSIVDFIKLGFIDETLGLLKNFVPWDAVKDKMGDFWKNITGAFQGAIDWVKDNWKEIATWILFPFPSLINKALDMFGVKSAMTGAMGDIVKFVSDRVDDIVKFFTGLPDRIVTALSGLANALSGAFKGAFNAVIDIINPALDAMADAIQIMKNLADAIPGPNPLGNAMQAAIDALHTGISPLAAGGIVTRPTLALLGEHVPEAVIPLGQSGFRGGDTHYHTHIETTVQGSILSERDLKRVVAEGLRRGEFRGLGVPA